MDPLNNHSSGEPETVFPVPDRSRFLTAIGFPRTESRGSAPSEASTAVELSEAERDDEAAGEARNEGGGIEVPKDGEAPVIPDEGEPRAEVALATDSGRWSWETALAAADAATEDTGRRGAGGTLGDLRPEVKPFTPLEEGPGDEAGEAELEASDPEGEVALKAEWGPDFPGTDGMERLEAELLEGFSDDEPAGPANAAPPAKPAGSAMPWLSPRSAPVAVAAETPSPASVAGPWSGPAAPAPAESPAAGKRDEAASPAGEATGWPGFSGSKGSGGSAGLAGADLGIDFLDDESILVGESGLAGGWSAPGLPAAVRQAPLEIAPAAGQAPVEETSPAGPEAKSGLLAPRTASAAAEVVDVSCPVCQRGLSLLQEHIGIAGHCVWCETPIIAAASGLSGDISVYVLGAGTTKPVEAVLLPLALPAPAPASETPVGAPPAPDSEPSPDAGAFSWVAAGSPSPEPAAPAGVTEAGFDWALPAASLAADPPATALDASPSPEPAPVSAFEWKPPIAAAEPLPFGVPGLEAEAEAEPDPSPLAEAEAAGPSEAVGPSPFQEPAAPAVAGDGPSFASPPASPFDLGKVEQLSDLIAGAGDSGGPGAGSGGGSWLESALGSEPAGAMPSVPASPFPGWASGPAKEEKGTDLASIAGTDRAEALSRSLWPAPSGDGVAVPQGFVLSEPAAELLADPAPPPVETIIEVDPGRSQPEPVAAPKASKWAAWRGFRPKISRKLILRSVVVLGLLAGIGMAALFWNDVWSGLRPGMQAALQKIQSLRAAGDGPSEAAANAPGNTGVPGTRPAAPRSGAGTAGSTAATAAPGEPKSRFDSRPLRILDEPAPPLTPE